MSVQVSSKVLSQLQLTVQDKGNGSYVADFTHLHRRKDDLGALYYVIAVIFIYGFSIILMIASHVRKNKMDTKLRHYTKEIAKVRKSERRLQCINILHATSSRERAKSQPQLVVTDSAGNEESSLIAHSPNRSYTCLQSHGQNLQMTSFNDQEHDKNNSFPSPLESKVRLDIPVHLPKKATRSGRRQSSPIVRHLQQTPDLSTLSSRSPRTPDSIATSTSSVSFWMGSDDSEASEPPSPRFFRGHLETELPVSPPTRRPTDV